MDFTISNMTGSNLQLLLSSGRIFGRNPELRNPATRIVPLGRLMSAAQVEVAVSMLISHGAEDPTRNTSLVDDGGFFWGGEGQWVI